MGLLNVQHLAISLLAFIIYLAILAIYRLYFSPVAHFPRRTLAAITFWYEFYWDVIRQGQYTFEIEKMHRKYGPIVRINPNELHIKDPAFHEVVYPYAAAGKRVERDPRQARMFGSPGSFFSTVSHELHRIRRSAISQFFSKHSVTELEPAIRYHVDKATARLQRIQNTGTTVNLFDLYACLTGDIISDYAYSKPYGFLESDHLAPELRRGWQNILRLTGIAKQFPWFLSIIQSAPNWLVLQLQPDLLATLQIQKDARKRITALKLGNKDKDKSSQHQHRTIFEELVESGLPEEEKSVDRLVDESFIVMGAGTLTTAHVLSITSFHLLNDASRLKKLQEELKPVMGAKWQDLENLPYLTAVIKEGLRIAYGVSGRMLRVFPDHCLQYGDWIIPAKTRVGMSTYFMHNDPDIFPEPRMFKPERWLGTDRLEKYLTSFSRGTRQCVGIHLTYAELYLTLAAVFAPGQFNLELFETDHAKDVEMHHDIVNPMPRLDSKGIRVLVN